jgi:hypothetical protein
MPCLLASAIKARKPLLRSTISTYKNLGKKPKEWKPLGKTVIYK